MNHLGNIIILTLCFLLLAGCPAHVQLGPLPHPSASKEKRLEAYREYAPSSKVYTTTYTFNKIGYTYYGSSSTSLNRLILGNGKSIFYPQDLLPLISPTSETASKIKEYESKSNLYLGLTYTGVGVMLLSIPVILFSQKQWKEEYSFGTKSYGHYESQSLVPALSIAAVGLGVMLVGVFVGYNASSLREDIFNTYHIDLLKNLELSISDMSIKF